MGVGDKRYIKEQDGTWSVEIQVEEHEGGPVYQPVVALAAGFASVAFSDDLATPLEAIQAAVEQLVDDNEPASNATVSALDDALIVKAAAGVLYGFSGFNSGPAQFIQVHDDAAVPANGEAPVLVFEVGADQPFSVDFGRRGRAFASGIVLCNSSTLATKTIGAADCWFDAQFE